MAHATSVRWPTAEAAVTARWAGRSDARPPAHRPSGRPQWRAATRSPPVGPAAVTRGHPLIARRAGRSATPPRVCPAHRRPRRLPPHHPAIL